MQALPAFDSTTFTPLRVLVDLQGVERGEDVVLDSGNTDTANTPTTRFREGNVVVLRTSTGRYVEADDTNGDVNTAASVTSLITNPGAGGWDGTLTITGHWGSLSVTLSADNTDAAVATAIIAAAAAVNPESSAPITSADEVADSVVSVTNADVGAGTWLKVTHTTVTTAFGADGADAAGVEADYRITSKFADLVDADATAVHAPVSTLMKGHFDESNLINLTAQAKAAFLRRGSRFS
mgnify:CR=1 FL=1